MAALAAAEQEQRLAKETAVEQLALPRPEAVRLARLPRLVPEREWQREPQSERPLGRALAELSRR
jgi:hypothetical protein